MALVAAKCTQCGANIKVDDTKDAGICEFCGTAYVTEKTINNYNTYVTNNYEGTNITVIKGESDNYVKLGNIALKSNNYQEAYDYANKALEIKIECVDAWILRLYSLQGFGTIGNPRLDEMLACAKNAVSYSSSESTESIAHTVWFFVANHSVKLMNTAINQCADVLDLLKTIHENPSNLSLVLNSDRPFRDLIGVFANNSVDFGLSVPNEYLLKYEDIQDAIVELGKGYLLYCKKDLTRVEIAGGVLVPQSVSGRKKILERIKAVLPEEKKGLITGPEISKGESSGCYIATAVYGSYDCPEVWTLRRFRDGYLKNSILGNAFVKIYYAISPHIVNLCGENTLFVMASKQLLNIIVMNLNKNGYENSPYKDLN